MQSTRYEPTSQPAPLAQPPRLELSTRSTDRVPPESWERALGKLVTGQAADDEIGTELARDRAVHLVETLIHEFRGSMIVALLPLTSRLLMLALGPQMCRVLFEDYWSKTRPQMFASLEAEAFGEYLSDLELKVPRLAAVLHFERAGLATLVDGQTRVVPFEFEPLPLLRALAEGRLPDDPGQSGAYEIELTPDEMPLLTATLLGESKAAVPFH